MNLVDTSGWIEYVFDGKNASFFAEPIARAAELIVPVVCIYEVFKMATRVTDEDRTLQIVGQMRRGHVIPVSEQIAIKAALISLKHGLPMADSLIYATAQLHNADIWTQDQHFEKLPGVRYKSSRSKDP